MELTVEPTITSFLLKITSRCNLNCDYCYVFNHADQSWRLQPPLMSAEIRKTFSKRLAEYCSYKKLENCLVIFHGGEPLLMNVQDIIQTAEWIREAVSSPTKVDFTLQTNGGLLTAEKLEKLSVANIGVSLSLDGPQKINDLHRLTHKGHSSFTKTMQAYNLLKQYPSVFTGVLGVIDVRTSPKELLEFFDSIGVTNLDLLLPDSNHLTPPPFRNENPNLYIDWLTEAFDLWIHHYPHMKLRTFESLISTLLGKQSGTDFFGFGDVILLGVETDGSYHDLDVLKITQDGFSHLNMNIFNTSVLEASLSSKIYDHRRLLTFEGLSSTCKQCSIVEVCGGGSLPHRFNGKDFNNPTIYCKEMLALVPYVQQTLIHLLHTNEEILTLPVHQKESLDINPLNYNNATSPNLDFEKIYRLWEEKSFHQFLAALDYVSENNSEYENLVNALKSSPSEKLKKISMLPSTHLWSTVALKNKKKVLVFDLDEKPIHFDPHYLKNIQEQISSYEDGNLLIHQENPWLRLPFGSKIYFEDQSFIKEAQNVLNDALRIIELYNSSILEEMKLISPVIQFIRDPEAHPEKLVSFSDNIVPGALYICMRQGTRLADPYDIADSIIHEYRHQKLYLLEHYGPIVASDFPYVSSPWREEKRPVSGLYHAVFVFHELEKYWSYLSKQEGEIALKAQSTNSSNRRMLFEGMKTLHNCQLTQIGQTLLDYFSKTLSETVVH